MELFIPGHPHKKLYIMRGIPGCGKSHHARQLAPDDQIFSSDKFFGEGEEYKNNWKVEKVHLGHRDCEAKAKAAMKQGVSPVVVDNTNINLSAFRFYLDMAVAFGYEVYFVYPNSPWWDEIVGPFLDKKTPDTTDDEYDAVVAQILDKNIHGVPPETLKSMMQRWTWPKIEEYIQSIEQRIVETERVLNDLRTALAYVSENT